MIKADFEFFHTNDPNQYYFESSSVIVLTRFTSLFNFMNGYIFFALINDDGSYMKKIRSQRLS
jgi:hypothetical protein